MESDALHALSLSLSLSLIVLRKKEFLAKEKREKTLALKDVGYRLLPMMLLGNGVYLQLDSYILKVAKEEIVLKVEIMISVAPPLLFSPRAL